MKLGCFLPVGLSALLPGCGHIADGRPGRGLLLFFLFGFAIDGFLYSQAQTILPPERATVSPAVTRILAIAAGLLVWAYCVADSALRALRCRRLAASAASANAPVREALVAYLRNDHAAAIKAIQAALRLNSQDPDALFYLGVFHASSGQSRKARRALYACIRYDDEGKWDDEAHEQLRALEAAPPPLPIPRSSPAAPRAGNAGQPREEEAP